MSRAYCPKCDEEVRTDRGSPTGWSHVEDETPDDELCEGDEEVARLG